MPRASIVIPTHNEGDSLFLTVEALLHTCPADTEILVVNDNSTDHSLAFLEGDAWPGIRRLDLPRGGISETRNEGARLARGETVVFLDAHCIPKPGWLPPLLEVLADHPESLAAPCISVLGNTAVKGYGADLAGPDLTYHWRAELPTPDPHPVPVAAGCALAMRRDHFLQLGGFDPMRTYGLEDVELCLRVWLLGGSVHVVPESEVAHLFKQCAQYEVPWRDYLYNRLRVATLHFDGERLARLLAHFRQSPDAEEAEALLDASDVFCRRDHFRAVRRHDADWFCERFALAI